MTLTLACERCAQGVPLAEMAKVRTVYVNDVKGDTVIVGICPHVPDLGNPIYVPYRG